MIKIPNFLWQIDTICGLEGISYYIEDHYGNKENIYQKRHY